ncbi:MAG: nitroreductase family protein [Eubacteriales bacterium]
MLGNETLKSIKQRRSCRSYRNEQVAEEALQAILEAGAYAPNAMGEATHYAVVQNKEVLEKINRLAKEAAMHMDVQLRELGANEAFNCYYGAPTLVIVSADTKSPMPMDADCSAAIENMLVAAESLGLGTCWIFFATLAFGSPEGEALKKELGIPEGYRVYHTFVLGRKKDNSVYIPFRKANVSYVR